MQNFKKTTWSLALATVATVSAYAAQGTPITVMLDGKPVVFENAPPKEMGGRVLIPVRGVLEQLGAQVGWDEAAQKVTATKADLDVELRIGQHMAQVNGEPKALDVPAQNYNGSTMVPLRFLSEALGASVDWDATTRTVQITTAQASIEPSVPSWSSNNRARPTAMISDFSPNVRGFVKADRAIRFTMTGTPGGQATFEIPGIADNIPMQETSPGTYVGEWRPSPNSDIPALSDISAVGHLSIEGSDKMMESTRTFSIDNKGPRIYAMRPGNDGALGNSRPSIGARLGDGAGSGVDSESIRFSLDGHDDTGEATVSDSQLTYTPEHDLRPGPHEAILIARDRAGNETTQKWTFDIADRKPRPRRLTFGDQPSYGPGTHLNLTLEADPGSTATLYFGDRAMSAPVREVSPGRYEAEYTIRPEDALANRPVRAKIRAADGSEYWVDADRMMPGPRELLQPTILRLHENDTVGSPLILQGTATPYSDIQIHVSSSALLLLNQVRIHGTVGDYSVSTDEHGHWQSPPINLDKARGANKNFAITVYAMDSNGKKSPVTTLNVSK